MALHRLTQLTVGVPDVEAARGFYRSFGLTEHTGEPGRFSTADGGEQLRLVRAARRGLVVLGLGVDDPDDLDRVEQQVAAFGQGATAAREGEVLVLTEPVADLRIEVAVAPRVDGSGPGTGAAGLAEVARLDDRAEPLGRHGPVRPRRLSHVVLGCTDAATTQRFFTDALGFKVSDRIGDMAAFLRCSTDHHNVLIQHAPLRFLHHTSWLVDDVDEIGRGAKSLLDEDPTRHVWGLGRHFIGSNFFWYLKDPAGNFAEYSCDLDVIVDDERWEPGVFEDERALYAWGPPVPGEFLAPDDVVALIAEQSG